MKLKIDNELLVEEFFEDLLIRSRNPIEVSQKEEAYHENGCNLEQDIQVAVTVQIATGNISCSFSCIEVQIINFLK